jgi:cytochrome c-type biogenesis protein CcmF
VAASSSFQTSRDLRLRPGQTAQVGDYQVTYVRPTREIDTAENRLTLGSVLAVTKNGQPFATLYPSRNYYAAATVTPGTGPLRSFFEGEATSEVGRKTQASGDVWTAMQPDLNPLRNEIARGDQALALTRAALLKHRDPKAAAKYAAAQGVAIDALSQYYLQNPPPADFRVNVNPLVIWIWIGGAISLLGALVAIWPAPEARRRRVADVYAARLARDLGSAG